MSNKYIIKIIGEIEEPYVNSIHFNLNEPVGNYDILYSDLKHALTFRLKSNAEHMVAILNNSELQYNFEVKNKEEIDMIFQGHLNFGDILVSLKEGKRVARLGWNGKNQFVVLMPAYLSPVNTQDTHVKVNDRIAKHIGKDTPLDSQSYFVLFNAQGKWQPGWVPSVSDCLAEDWIELPNNDNVKLDEYKEVE